MPTREVTISNKLGLHARAAAKLVNISNGYNAEVTLEKKGQKINGKSIMGVMMLAASQGTTIRITVSGEEEEEALRSLIELIDDKFGEPE
jgi:phosphocarrier protein